MTPNKNYNRGRAREYSTIKILECAGYSCFRSAGSHGPFDIIAYNKNCIRFIQCKLDCKPTASELEELKSLNNLPPNSTKEIWTYVTGKSVPSMEVL